MSGKTYLLAALCATPLVLIGCGGSSSSNSSPTPAEEPLSEPLSGVFLDAAVEGLVYHTATIEEGTTDEDGTFLYREGETVIFTLLGQVLGESAGGSVVTPLSLQLQDDETHPDFALNIVRFLLTLDEEQDPAKIRIPSIDRILDIDFNLATEDFEEATAVKDFLADEQICVEEDGDPEKCLVGKDAAIAHFSTTLGGIDLDYDIGTVALEGRVANSVIRYSGCPGYETAAGWKYTFDSSGISIEGSDSFSESCTSNINDTKESFVAGYEEYEDLPFSCTGGVCSFSDVNQTVAGTDEDGREFISTYSHTPGTSIFRYSKKITSGDDEGSYYFEHIALDDYHVNLAGRTATSTLYSSECPDTELGWHYTFSSSGMTLNGSDSLIAGCGRGANDSFSLSFAEIASSFPDFPFNCNSATCTFEEVNKVVTGVDGDGREFRATMGHIPGSRTFTVVKRISGGPVWTEIIRLH